MRAAALCLANAGVIGSGLEFGERGVHQLKGVPGEWHTFAVGADGQMDARPVSEVDPEVAALTPGALETLRGRDRAFLAAATRTTRAQRRVVGAILHGRRSRRSPNGA